MAGEITKPVVGLLLRRQHLAPAHAGGEHGNPVFAGLISAGRGVPQDLTKAYYWSVLAQAGGDQASKYRVAVLTSRMSRGQVVAAQQQADDWLRNFAGRAPISR